MNPDEGTDTSAVPGGAGAVETPLDVALVQDFEPQGLYALRAAVAAHASELGFPERRIGRLLLVVTELATNAIRHGGGGGRLLLWRTGEAIHVTVMDRGPGIDRPATIGVDPVPLAAPGGRGLWIVRQLCDQVRIASSAGTAVTVTLDLDAAAP